MNDSILEKLYIETAHRIAIMKSLLVKSPQTPVSQRPTTAQRSPVTSSHQPKVQTSTPKDASQFGPQKLPHITVGAITGKIIRPVRSK